MKQAYTYAAALAASERINWRVEDLIGGDKRLDFIRPFLPESPARVAPRIFLSPAEQRTLNQIRGLGYLYMYGGGAARQARHPHGGGPGRGAEPGGHRPHRGGLPLDRHDGGRGARAAGGLRCGQPRAGDGARARPGSPRARAGRAAARAPVDVPRVGHDAPELPGALGTLSPAARARVEEVAPAFC